jgi:hypothetical protein
MPDSNFWKGLRLMTSGLVEAAKKASYSVACGAGGLGFAIWGVGALGITGPASLLIPMAAFFLLARLGRLLDERSDRRSLDATLEEFLTIQQFISERQLELTEEQRIRLKELTASQEEYIKIKNAKMLEELKEKMKERP